MDLKDSVGCQEVEILVSDHVEGMPMAIKKRF